MNRIQVLAAASLALLSTLTPQLWAQDYEALAKDVAQELAARQYDKVEARFDATMASAMPLDKLQSFWDAALAQAGAFKSVTSVASAERQGYHVVTLTCAFEKAPLNLRLAFDKDSKIAGFFLLPVAPPWTPPDYANPAAFHERTVTVITGTWQLPGTLTEPNGAGPFPAVVLVQGSGPHDEDESIGGNKPFKDLAWGLASRGIVVLRYEKRTHKYAEQYVKDLGNLTVKEEVTDDARAAAALLAQQPEVSKERICVLGHSLGGMLAPRIAEGDSQIAGIIIMAGSTRPFGQIVVDQINYLSTLSGAVGEGAKTQIEAAAKFAQDYNSPTLKPGETVSMLDVKLPAAYVLDLRSYDPAATAARLKIPILVLQGMSDYQVTKKDLEGWEKALAGHNNVTIKTYPGLCHLFTPGGNPPSPVDYDKPGHVAKGTLDDIASWVDAQHGEPR
jgi:dienelactone hydrolase